MSRGGQVGSSGRALCPPPVFVSSDCRLPGAPDSHKAEAGEAGEQQRPSRGFGNSAPDSERIRRHHQTVGAAIGERALGAIDGNMGNAENDPIGPTRSTPKAAAIFGQSALTDPLPTFSAYKTKSSPASRANWMSSCWSLLQNSISATHFAFIRRCERPRLRPARAGTA